MDRRPVTKSFDEAFEAISGAQQQAAHSAAQKLAEVARSQVRARAVAEPVLREAGHAVRQKLVALGLAGRFDRRTMMLPDWNGGSHWDFGVTRDGYLVYDTNLRGPAGFEDLLSKVAFLPENPREDDLRSSSRHVFVDHRGVVVYTKSGYTNDRVDPPTVIDIHVRLAESVAFLLAHPVNVKYRTDGGSTPNWYR
jgi:hypothetical protein